MTTKYAPITMETAAELVEELRPLLRHPDGDRARRLFREVGEAMGIAAEYREHVELLGAELVELIARITGRTIETPLSRRTLEQCAAALEEMTPVLGATVIELPRAPERATLRAVEAAANEAVARMPPPISVRLWVDLVERLSFDDWEAPRKGELLRYADTWVSVVRVRRNGPGKAEVYALTMPDDGGAESW
jgi:hypothetical protein